VRRISRNQCGRAPDASVFGLNWDTLWRHRDEFIIGLALGLKLALIGLALACVIGMLAAFARTSRHRWLSMPAAAYVEVIRNIPLLLILFFLYFGVPMWANSALPRDLADVLVLDGENTAILALAIYGGAYLAEVFRAGILGVGRSFLEAGRSLGLSGLQIARYVTLPIMARTVLPSLGNTFISLFKDTSLAMAIAVPELTFVTRKFVTDTFQFIQAWTAAAILYLATTYALAAFLRVLERRIRWTV
jgi:His/Glu/Gln/Arg/opine family amino acid ABC transporter permease subunit